MSGIPSSTYGSSYDTGYEEYRGGKAGTEPDSHINEWMDIIAKRKEEIVEKVRRGETEPSIPTGAASYTYRQWDRLMRKVDRAIDAMQERVQADKEEQEMKIKKKKADSITMEMLEELLGIEVEDGSVITDGKLSKQISGEERFAVENAFYSIQPESDGIFRIMNKNTGLEYTFVEAGCSLKADRDGRTFLMPSGDYAQTGSVMVADETLVSMLAQYFGTDDLKAGVLAGYTFERNAETGIEIMIPPGMKGKTAHMLFQCKEDVEAYERLVQTYRSSYPNLVQSDEMAKFYASLEIEGLCHRTETGILYTNAGGVGYADENNPQKNWWIALDGQSDENYETIMEMMEQIRENGKKVESLPEWQTGLRDKGIEYVMLEFDEACGDFLVQQIGRH